MALSDIWLVYYSLDGSAGQGDFVHEDAGWFRSELAAQRWIDTNGQGEGYWPDSIKQGATPRAKEDGP